MKAKLIPLKQLLQRPRQRNLLLLLLTFLVSALVISYLCLPSQDQDGIAQIRYKNLQNAKLPKDLKTFLLQKPGSELNLIYYDGKKIRYHEEFRGDLNMQLCLAAMQLLARSPQHKLPTGYYLFSFRDGVHEPFARPWPVLAFAGSKDMVANKEVFLIPDYEAMQGYQRTFALIDRKLPDYPWQKKQAKIFWRGAASGTRYNNTDLNGSPRLRFMNIASKLKFADVGLTGTPLFINTDFNNKLLTLHPLKKPVPPEEAIANKYLMDIDGISCSFSRMAWILYSNSMLMKHQSEKIQWYYDQLQPFVHYVPIAADFSDLQEKFNWAQTHQQEAQQIAHNGRELAQKVFAPEHILKAFESALLAYQEEMEAMLAKRD